MEAGGQSYRGQKSQDLEKRGVNRLMRVEIWKGGLRVASRPSVSPSGEGDCNGSVTKGFRGTGPV